jgi:hypothetical protein
VLLRLGGAKESPAVVDPDDGSVAVVPGPESTKPPKSEPQPQVLPIDPPDDGAIENMAQRPKRTSASNRSTKSTRR